MSSVPEPRHNHFLAALPEKEFNQWIELLEPVQLHAGQILNPPGRPAGYAYFPVTAIVSLLYTVEDGSSVEVALVGNEGFVGLPLSGIIGTTMGQCLVQSAGQAFRLHGQFMKPHLRTPPVADLLLDYVQSLMMQIGQTAACSRHHSLEQQMCRRFLSLLDRSRGEELAMTQEHMANMLGARREKVSETALKLQREGVIRYARGHISMPDRVALDKRTCECYGLMRQEFHRLWKGTAG